MDQKTLDTLGITQEMLDQRVREDERERIYDLFCAFRDYAKKHKERYLNITFWPDGAGNINLSEEPGANEWVAWDDLDEGPAKLKEAIRAWEEENH